MALGLGITRNLYVLLVIVFYLSTSISAVDYRLLEEYNVCDPQTLVFDPPTVYMPQPGDSTEVFINWLYGSERSMPCYMLFKTCEQCRIKVEAVMPPFVYSPCQRKSSEECSSGCIYLYLHDNFYKTQTSQWISQSREVSGYESQSAQLHVAACVKPDFPANVTMRLRLSVIEKVQLIAGDAYEALPRRTFMSPYFPDPYVKNSELYTYKFQAASQTDYIAVTFDDWIVSPYSSFKFTGANIDTPITGDDIQRPYIISDGQSMTMEFNTGEHRIPGTYFTFLGFKAVARFYKNRDEIPTYKTDCDRMISSSEGGIIHMGTAADGYNRDCIWIIKKLHNFHGVYLKIIRYRTDYNTDPYSTETPEHSLLVNGGITSEGDQRFFIRPQDRSYPSYSIQLSEDGYYIRLKGRYFTDDSLVMAFAMYLNDCQDYRNYFKCDNGRCIPERLKCDTYDHCGDNSDEQSSLCGFTSGGGNQGNNGSSSYSYSISIGVIIPMVVSVFLVIIMCLLIIFIRRCRRLNNSAFGQGTQVPRGQQSRGRRRRRRNQNVQMNVTVSSGEHPPSYDEVIDSTPIGYLNMAFSWAHPEFAVAQPPSYEEATSPTATSSASVVDTTNTTVTTASTTSINNSHSGSSASISLSQRQAAPLLTTTLSASLDPRAEVSSSSSSEDASDNDHRLDLSSSSDSSTDNEHSLIQGSVHSITDRLGCSPSKANRQTENLGDEAYKRDNVKYSRENDSAQVIMESPTSVKFKHESSLGRRRDTDRGRERDATKAVRNDVGERKDNRVGQRSVENDSSRVRDEGLGERLDNVDECGQEGGFRNSAGHSAVGDNVSRDRRKREERAHEVGGISGRGKSDSMERDREIRVRDGDSRQGRGRSETYPEHRGRNNLNQNNGSQVASGRNHSRDDQRLSKDKSSSLDFGDQRSVRPPTVTEGSRSQSCADLLGGSNGHRLLDVAGMKLRDEDKRFSYAGHGDVSLKRGSLDPYSNGRGLVRDKPSEHLDRCASESYDSLMDSYSARKHANRAYETERDVASKNSYQDYHSPSNDSYQGEQLPGSRGRRNKPPDHSRSPGRLTDSHQQYSSLAPVQESLQDDSDDMGNRPDATRQNSYGRDLDSRNEHFRGSLLSPGATNLERQSNPSAYKANPYPSNASNAQSGMAADGSDVSNNRKLRYDPAVSSSSSFHPTIPKKPKPANLKMASDPWHSNPNLKQDLNGMQPQNLNAKPLESSDDLAYQKRIRYPLSAHERLNVTRPADLKGGVFSIDRKPPPPPEQTDAQRRDLSHQMVPPPEHRQSSQTPIGTAFTEAYPKHSSSNSYVPPPQRPRPTPAPRSMSNKRKSTDNDSSDTHNNGTGSESRSVAAENPLHPHDQEIHTRSASSLPRNQDQRSGSGNNWGPNGPEGNWRNREGANPSGFVGNTAYVQPRYAEGHHSSSTSSLPNGNQGPSSGINRGPRPEASSRPLEVTNPSRDRVGRGTNNLNEQSAPANNLPLSKLLLQTTNDDVFV